MTGQGYSVDLDYLQDTIKKLQGVCDSMGGPEQCAVHDTNLESTDFGHNFVEATQLHQAHETMRSEIQGMITSLKSMIQDFHGRTTQVHNGYQQHETATSDSMMNH
ncbi:hypothetical protein [Phaeacidiphilus oryzae]|uniref:hypothetical protein n=1 Tax=Phaeacidiphilus oryzae TaxID=348818 RepID=UPI000689B3D0|nr:hypothetical protein [Phaeacidiphilus oryzae]